MSLDLVIDMLEAAHVRCAVSPDDQRVLMYAPGSDESLVYTTAQLDALRPDAVRGFVNTVLRRSQAYGPARSIGAVREPDDSMSHVPDSTHPEEFMYLDSLCRDWTYHREADMLSVMLRDDSYHYIQARHLRSGMHLDVAIAAAGSARTKKLKVDHAEPVKEAVKPLPYRRIVIKRGK